ncbi:MAG: hypothetical protein IPL61_21270 [Myxococcales bacterium]|nr:hypothetical protein [Myxococcales bacterium]
MTRLAAPLALALLAGACSDDAPAPRNPDKLWLALDGSEIQVQLVGSEPPPF